MEPGPVRMPRRQGDHRLRPNGAVGLAARRRVLDQSLATWREQLVRWTSSIRKTWRATLKALDMLRVQDDGNLQIMAKVGGKGMRVYCVDGKKLAEFRAVAARGFGGFGADRRVTSRRAKRGVNLTGAKQSRRPRRQARSRRQRRDRRNVEVARIWGWTQTSKEFGAILRAKATLINTALKKCKSRVDEGQIKSAAIR